MSKNQEIEKLHASMATVARLLREEYRAVCELKNNTQNNFSGNTYNFLSVHCDRLCDFALELESPGMTKYAPNSQDQTAGALPVREA
jgi:hypothetical protein